MDRARPETSTRRRWLRNSFGDAAMAWSDFADDMAGAVDSLIDTMTEAPPMPRQRPHRRQRPSRRKEMCGCRPDPCHCTCCVYDADLVVYARLFERRVVPVRISNERARSRQITLELSEFTTSGGKPTPVRGSIATRTEFELEPCAHEDAVLLLEIGDADGDWQKYARETAKVPDVDDCLVAYADLRIQGCNVRPVRIAVALLPRDCDAYEVHCACGCC